MARPALAATRAIEIVNFLAAHPTESFTLSDIVKRLEINVASTHAILAALTKAGYLTRHPRLHTYTLGPSLVAVGSAALEQHPAIDECRHEIRRLSEELDLDIAVTAVAGDDVVFVARSGTHHPRGIPTYVGLRTPLRPPLGSLYVAWASHAEVADWLARQPTAPPDAVESFLADVAAARRHGFAVARETGWRRDLGLALEHVADRPSEDRARAEVETILADPAEFSYHVNEIAEDEHYAISSIAAPVFGDTGQVILALNLVGLPEKVTGADLLTLATRLRDAGVVVTKRTRGRPPEEFPG